MTLKVGIDSYSYHRLFGEVYPGQEEPEKILTTKEFLARAKELDVDGVSLESCFIESYDDTYLAELKAILDDYGFDRVWAWGHPDGLEGGKNEDAFEDMINNISYARAIGADIMRVVGSSLAFRFDPHEPQLKKLTEMFNKAAKVAEEAGVKLAVENHFDFDTKEFVKLIEDVNSPYFGINFDTGNFMRLLDEPVKSMRDLGKHVMATHIKDLKITPDTAADEWYFFSCVAVGDGYVNVKGLAEILQEVGYTGMLAVELDYPHPDVGSKEDEAVAKSISKLKEIVASL